MEVENHELVGLYSEDQSEEGRSTSRGNWSWKCMCGEVGTEANREAARDGFEKHVREVLGAE